MINDLNNSSNDYDENKINTENKDTHLRPRSTIRMGPILHHFNFEVRVLRRIFGSKRDDMTGVWRKFHNEELHNLYSSPYIIRAMKSRRTRWAEHVALMWEVSNAYKILIGKPEGKIPLVRPRRRCEDNIKMDLTEIGVLGLVLDLSGSG
jgi:hypothetical protein